MLVSVRRFCFCRFSSQNLISLVQLWPIFMDPYWRSIDQVHVAISKENIDLSIIVGLY